MKWYFQFNPHDLYDYDAVQTPVLVNAKFKNKPRKLVVTANRNGFLYILDRTNWTISLFHAVLPSHELGQRHR